MIRLALFASLCCVLGARTQYYSLLWKVLIDPCAYSIFVKCYSLEIKRKVYILAAILRLLPDVLTVER